MRTAQARKVCSPIRRAQVYRDDRQSRRWPDHQRSGRRAADAERRNHHHQCRPDQGRKRHRAERRQWRNSHLHPADRIADRQALPMAGGELMRCSFKGRQSRQSLHEFPDPIYGRHGLDLERERHFRQYLYPQRHVAIAAFADRQRLDRGRHAPVGRQRRQSLDHAVSRRTGGDRDQCRPLDLTNDGE